MVTAAAPARGTGRCPIVDAVWRLGSTTWMTFTGCPAPAPVTASPPKTYTSPPVVATAGYRTGTGSDVTAENVRPSVVARTTGSGLVPSYPPTM